MNDSTKTINTKNIKPLEGRPYDPKEVEADWYDIWENMGAFKPEYSGPGREPNGKPWCCIIPPPNITAQLHMGHGLNFTLQDLVTRIRRMEGFDVLWLPGIDHAGIATQVQVEKALKAEGTSREEVGYDKFMERAWKWKEENGGRILEQIRELGSSCDWDRLCFTLDPGPSKGVLTAFKQLYEKGLIYRDYRMVNWSPELQSAISDLEVIYHEEEGALYYINYPMKDGSGHIQVATTRPETMLADTAVAVHPEDARFKDMIGKIVIQPLSGVEMPVIADTYVSMEFGTGALKITPAHDPNDYEVGRRHNLEMPSMLGLDGKLNDLYPPYEGLDAKEARKRAIDELTNAGHLVKTEPMKHQVGHCQRSGCTVEPMLSEQWFCTMTDLVGPANDAVGDVDAKPGEFDCTFFAQRWAKVHHDWINPDTIQPWCISRQLWWGHRIPAFYCADCKHIMVSLEAPEKCETCDSTSIKQDPDVLDTWFSSWLWPLTTLGWPDETDDLKKFYPTDFLLTAYDIIFFWVARMIIAGYEFRGATPFDEVVYTGLIRDEHGRKMSKSSGNAVDPLVLIDEFGRDALRFTLTHLSFSGSQDINLTPTRLQGSRYFMNKIWNVSKYVIGQIGTDFTPTPIDELFGNHALTLPDRWILSRLTNAVKGIETQMKIYDFGQYASILYSFVWDEFCDWYVEVSKFHLGENEASERKQLVRSILYHTLVTILKLLHPVSPYISEELHAALHGQGDAEGGVHVEYAPLIVETWPGTFFEDKSSDEEVEAGFEKLQALIRAFRNNRKSIGLADSATINEVMYMTDDGILSGLVSDNELDLQKLINASKITLTGTPPSKAISTSVLSDTVTTYLPIDESLNLDREIERLEKEIEKKKKYSESISKKLSNRAFTEKAPPKVIEKEREKLSEAETQITELTKRLTMFQSAAGN